MSPPKRKRNPNRRIETVSVEGETVLDAANKEGSVQPTGVLLAPKVKRAKRAKKNLAQAVSFEKDTVLNKENSSSLDVPSQ